ncbi:MAG TPA: KpsF/GutQ family sugar-phosphate isomerase [Gemmatimonadales bacterium]
MTSRVVASGKRTLDLEARAIARVAEGLDERFGRAVALLRGATGRVIVSGVGKSGLIGRKLAATLTSTGTPAAFLHPVDSQHGDLGIVGREDVAIILSKSGESEELFGLLAALQRMEVPIIALTGGPESTLARAATVALDAAVAEEACPHDLAPTTSTTVALALGDALAVALLEEKGFSREAFAALHPGGRLGRKLLLRVRDVMLAPGPMVRGEEPMREVVMTLAHQRGIAMVGDGRRLDGVITAGDLTRLAERTPDFLSLPAAAVMTRTPKTTTPDDLAAAATGQMERAGIMVLPVVSAGGEVVGVVHLHDLMRAGAV